MKINVKEIFDKPKTMGIVGNVNEAKSNLIYHILDELNKYGKFKLYTYGLRNEINNSRVIYSVAELEKIRDSIILLDEFSSLINVESRKEKRQVENTLRLINHNNNILIIAGVPENFKKFIGAKLDMIFFKRVSYADLINGSRVKNVVLSYKGVESGSTILDINKGQALLFDGWGYKLLEIPYMESYDSKKENKPIINVTKKKHFNSKNVHNNVK